MPAAFTYPGVYITEKPSGAQAVPAAATSIALFVGMADRGPFGLPTRVQTLAEYNRLFGETSKGEMADQVGQFFINGGGDAYVMRIANGARQSTVRILSEGGDPALDVKARDMGTAGDLIRVEIDYATASPGRTFNLTVYRTTLLPDGKVARSEVETHGNLSMNPADARYVENVVNNASALITVEDVAPAPATVGGFSLSGLIFRSAQADARADVVSAISATANAFTVSVAGRPPVRAVIDTATPVTAANVESRLLQAVITAYQNAPSPVDLTGLLTLNLDPAPAGLPARLLEYRSTEGSVVISAGGQNDVAVPLMLGATAGHEMDHFSVARPMASGIVAILGPATGAITSAKLVRLFDFANADRQDVAAVTVTDPGSPTSPTRTTFTLAGTATAEIGLGTITAPNPTTAIGSLGYIRQALDRIATEIEAAVGARWRAKRQGDRLVLQPVTTLPAQTGLGVTLASDDDSHPGPSYDLSAAGKMFRPADATNIGAYMLGVNPGGGKQTAALGGLDGSKPLLNQYKDAYAVIESQVEIFNMMILPRADGQTDVERKALWGPASAFATAQRAILFVDPEEAWDTLPEAEAGADSIKVGVETRNSVVYWPRILIPTAQFPKGKKVDPSGSMAGLYARTDTRFGTWRAPAGIEATLTGVVGLEKNMSDAENGRLNPKAMNAIRLFPSGITSWGARMMVGADDTGNVDDKYVNVRRMMLFIENSLYRGLRFAVFKNNAEPLWASIRLAAGSFMNGLMRQGAFASQTKSEAYYVLCDSSTTTPNDINLGIVNVLVGFAPNKPAEFVHLTVTQIAGQADV